MDETFKEKFIRKTKENPFVFTGVGLSIYAMFKMTTAFRRNDQIKFQQYQRMRLGFSLATVLAITFGSIYQNEDRFKARIQNDYERLKGMLNL
jgi:hypothetical protein